MQIKNLMTKTILTFATMLMLTALKSQNTDTACLAKFTVYSGSINDVRVTEELTSAFAIN